MKLGKAIDSILFLIALVPFSVGLVIGFVCRAFVLGYKTGMRQLEE